MIALIPFVAAADLVKLRTVLEHTPPEVSHTFAVHYYVSGQAVVDIYVDSHWHDIIPKIEPLFELADDHIDVVVISASIIDCEVPPLQI